MVLMNPYVFSRQKFKLRCPLIKAWVTSDVLEAQEPVLMNRGVSNEHILVKA